LRNSPALFLMISFLTLISNSTAFGDSYVWDSSFEGENPSVGFGPQESPSETIINLKCSDYKGFVLEFPESPLPQDFLSYGELLFEIDGESFTVRSDASYSDYMGEYIPSIFANPESDKWISAFISSDEANIRLNNKNKELVLEKIPLRDLQVRAEALLQICKNAK
jgi:hypothetical protein